MWLGVNNNKGYQIRPQRGWAEIIIQEKTSSIFWRSVFPIFGQEKDEFPETAVIILSDENSLNLFYIMYVWAKVFIFCHTSISLKKVKKHHSMENQIPHRVMF